nr:alpha/beta hydrolase [Humibacillus sp. DSM 29435]
MAPDADLTMRGQVHLLADFMDALDLHDVTLVISDWGGPLFLTAEGRDERVSRLIITPCEAFDNFPPGLPGRAAELLAVSDVGMRAGLHLLRWGVARRKPMMFGWMVKRDIPARTVRAWTAPGLNDRRIRNDYRAYARGSWSKQHCVAATQSLSSFHGHATVLWAPENKVMPQAHGQQLARLLGTTVTEVNDAYVLLSEDQPTVLAQHISHAVSEVR